MKWFNYDNFAGERTPNLNHKYTGKTFRVTTKLGFSFWAKYCQIDNTAFKFIGKDGNRITDANSNIVKAVLQRKP